jgi:hypothetical protein
MPRIDVLEERAADCDDYDGHHRHTAVDDEPEVYIDDRVTNVTGELYYRRGRGWLLRVTNGHALWERELPPWRTSSQAERQLERMMRGA